jgi:hypothetical protein
VVDQTKPRKIVSEQPIGDSRAEAVCDARRQALHLPNRQVRAGGATQEAAETAGDAGKDGAAVDGGQHRKWPPS